MHLLFILVLGLKSFQLHCFPLKTKNTHKMDEIGLTLYRQQYTVVFYEKTFRIRKTQNVFEIFVPKNVSEPIFNQLFNSILSALSKKVKKKII